jgi:hypothetical protein
MPDRIHGWWDDIIDMVLGAYAEIGMLIKRTNEFGKAHSLLSFEVLPGSTIGLAQLPGSAAARCATGFFCKLDPGYAPNAIQVATLLAHEWGHNMDSGHISGDPIMHPSIRTGWNESFRGTQFGDRLSRWFGGEPVGDDEPPPDRTLTGTIMYDGNAVTYDVKRHGGDSDGAYLITGVEL